MDLEDRILYLEDRHARLSKSTDKLEGELKQKFDTVKDEKLKELKKLKLSVRDELEDLRNSAEFEIMEFCRDNSERIQEIANQQIEVLKQEIAELQIEADKLGKEIIELTNESLKIL